MGYPNERSRLRVRTGKLNILMSILIQKNTLLQTPKEQNVTGEVLVSVITAALISAEGIREMVTLTTATRVGGY